MLIKAFGSIPIRVLYGQFFAPLAAVSFDRQFLPDLYRSRPILTDPVMARIYCKDLLRFPIIANFLANVFQENGWN